MAESPARTPAAQLSRIFRKAGVLLAKGQIEQTLTVLREGETLARSLGGEEKLALFREEILRCEERLAGGLS
ncbi:MAG: hypothetical protein FJ147_14510 [Deltaproteobacteria bacterium]|nr:hypothetical protein [Deltaproteobacteria bacterium]